MKHVPYSVVFGCLLALAQPLPSWAACSIPLQAGDLSIAPAQPLIGQTIKLYATIQPECDADVEGTATFSVDGAALGSKAFSYKANGRSEEVWIIWPDVSYGAHTLRIETRGEGNATGGNASQPFFVDRDTDSDGVPDAQDGDDDNDGVLDGQDQFPLDATRSHDTDGDGIDDKADSDDDNDGLFDFKEQELKTNPLKRDTDADTVGDKEDAFPLDPKKSEKSTEERAPSLIQEVSAAAIPVMEEVSTTSTSSTVEVMVETTSTVMTTSELPTDATSTPSEKSDTADKNKMVPLWLLAGLLAAAGGFFYWKERSLR